MAWGILLYLVGALAAVAGSFFIGRRLSADTLRARELEVVIEDLRKDHECALSELEVGRHELKRRERELQQLRADLSDHFSGTVDLLRGLSRDYRAICDHMSQGAELLCPERAAAIEASLAPALLSEADDLPLEPLGRGPGPERVQATLATP